MDAFEARRIQQACKELKKTHPAGKKNVVGVFTGYKVTGGMRTNRGCCVVLVRKKLPEGQLLRTEIVPKSVLGVPTDVVEEGTIQAPPPERSVTPRALTDTMRPAPGGYSCGHYRITAGTLGCWVQNSDGRPAVLSNNHVLGDSNEGATGDRILQPGRVDGGVGHIALLTEYVRIKFDSGNGLPPLPPKKDRGISLQYWKAARAAVNAIPKLIGCQNRALGIGVPQAIEQPYPNLVDAAIATAVDDTVVDQRIALVGPLVGIRDLVLGDRVQKVGRTTSHTRGIVEGVDGSVQVDYGSSGTATFEGQVLIRSEDGGDFSAGGDSGSAILTMDGFLGGLLFAGGDRSTIANKISDVISLLGIRLLN